MRIRILRTPSLVELDGIDLTRFTPGQQYDVGIQLAAVMLAEGWGEPVGDDQPALLVPFSDSDPFMPRVMDRNTPPNLVRETYPPYVDDVDVALDLERRRRRRGDRHK
jgi:hypothetical protein